MNTKHKLNTQIDLYLTEISLELLGNKMYDVNGKRQHRIGELLKAGVSAQPTGEKINHSSDLICSLGYDDNFTEDLDSMTNFLEDQLDYILVDANEKPEVNESIISFLRNYKADQKKLLKEVSELHIKKLVEQRKMTTNLNKARQHAVNAAGTKEEKDIAVKRYYDNEKDQLLKSCADMQRLIKYILNDTEDDTLRGELIGFVHATRTIGKCENESKNKSQKVTKPYTK